MFSTPPLPPPSIAIVHGKSAKPNPVLFKVNIAFPDRTVRPVVGRVQDKAISSKNISFRSHPVLAKVLQKIKSSQFSSKFATPLVGSNLKANHKSIKIKNSGLVLKSSQTTQAPPTALFRPLNNKTVISSISGQVKPIKPLFSSSRIVPNNPKSLFSAQPAKYVSIPPVSPLFPISKPQPNKPVEVARSIIPPELKQESNVITQLPVESKPETDKTVQPTPWVPKPLPTTPFGSGVVELKADSQDYDEQKEIIIAKGNIVMRFQNAVLDSDRLLVNLKTQVMVAEGNVVLTRGDQVLRGERFEYFFVQDRGSIYNASGTIDQETITQDFDTDGTDLGVNAPLGRPLSDRIAALAPVTDVTAKPGLESTIQLGIPIQNQVTPGGVAGTSAPIRLDSFRQRGTVQRLRFQAAKVDFDGLSWNAQNIRITNDPFSPPELEVRATTAKLESITSEVDVLTTRRSQAVFDQNLKIPLFLNRVVFDRRDREPGIVSFGVDGLDRGGFYVFRTFDVINNQKLRFSLSPEFYAERAFFGDDKINTENTNESAAANFGVTAKLNAVLSNRTKLDARIKLAGFDFDNVDQRLRVNVRGQQLVGDAKFPHTVTMEYNYRDRLFNGSLGFQTVQNSIGALVTSPTFTIGKTGLSVSYQGSLQYIEANTDRIDLLRPGQTNNLIALGRYQGAALLSHSLPLWVGKSLPPTPTQGLRYSPTPVVPYLALNTGLTGVLNVYSSGDTQDSLNGTVSLIGQLGNFSRPFFDYTGFNLTYFQSVRGSLSPFLFDRIADQRVLTGGISQQIYGPVRAGFQTSLNLDTGQEISTDYFVELSRRTFNIILRYNPVQGLGSINFRINDFKWRGNPNPFDPANTVGVLRTPQG